LRRPSEISELAGIIEAAGSNRLLGFYGNPSPADPCQDFSFVNPRGVIFELQKLAFNE
jgi:hypothetical protein